jgi:hypothetical protein
MKKSYESPKFEIIELGDIDCITMSGVDQQFGPGEDPKIDFGSMFGNN